MDPATRFADGVVSRLAWRWCWRWFCIDSPYISAKPYSSIVTS